VLGQVRSDLAAASLYSQPSGSRSLSKHGSGAEAPDAASPRPAQHQGPASVALSTDADNGSWRPASDDGEMLLEDVALEAGVGAAGGGREASAPRDILGTDADVSDAAAGAPPPLGTSMAASSAAASPRSPGLAASPLFGRSVDDGHEPALRQAKALGVMHPGVNGGQPYQSRLMQELTAGPPEEGGAEGEDGRTHYSSSDASAAPSNAGSSKVSARSPRRPCRQRLHVRLLTAAHPAACR
jgi:hypothetical protein